MILDLSQMGALIRQLEGEIANLRSRLEAKAELHSRTNVHETYKVKTFEMAAKLATMDGTDDGMYNGLPIEVFSEVEVHNVVNFFRLKAKVCTETWLHVAADQETMFH